MTDLLFPARLPGTTVEGILSTTNNIDLTTSALTTLYTPSGKSCVVTRIIVRSNTASGFVSAASISIGQNTNVNDIIAITALTGLNATNQFFQLTPTSISVITLTGNPIKVKVTTPAVATTLTVNIDLVGYLF